MEPVCFGFEELTLWKECREFKLDIRRLALDLPPQEKYLLKDQLLRSSRSINAQISEGHGRYTFKDQVHFCVQARGSLSETVNHLIDAYDEGYICMEKLEELKTKAKRIQKLLNGYINYLRNRKETT